MSELSSFLSRKDDTDLVGQFAVVSDFQTDCSFLIHHFISQALKDGHVVYLVSFAQSFIHYNSIATKLGVNLSKCCQGGQLVFIDCLTRLLENCWTSGGRQDTTTAHVKEATLPHTVTYSLDSDASLRGLYRILHDSIAESRPDKPVCLVVDDLSVAMSVGVSLEGVVGFVHYCQQMLCAPDGLCEGRGYLVAMVHCDGEEEDVLKTHLLHRCDLSLVGKGLKTGYSKDVHGELWLVWRDPAAVSSGRRDSLTTKRHTQFKVMERTVQLFAKGTSKAVL